MLDDVRRKVRERFPDLTNAGAWDRVVQRMAVIAQAPEYRAARQADGVTHSLLGRMMVESARSLGLRAKSRAPRTAQALPATSTRRVNGGAGQQLSKEDRERAVLSFIERNPANPNRASGARSYAGL